MSSAAREYKPGERVPGTVYDVVRRLGSGGMGTVYDVEDTSIGKRYVLKALHPQLGARDDLARRTQNEARTLARLHHPNIVEVITAGVTGDDLRLPYYVMERLNGQSLRVVLEKKGQIELSHAYHIAIDLLDALDHAHDKGVIHRDVKPDNIFLHRTAAGATVTKLLDFGIVSLLDATVRETAGRFLGTLRYAAPEQLRGDRPTPKMDLYCAGLVLFEMVAGRGPFDDAGDSSKIATAHLNRPAPPLSSFVVVPEELSRLVASALEKDPDARVADAFSFASSLRNLKRAGAAATSPDPTGGRATSPALTLGTDSRVDLRRPSADGSLYDVSPARSPAAPPEPLPKVTLPGLAGPTQALAAATVPLAGVTATSLDAVDRHATTGVLVHLPRPAAVAGTEGFTASTPLAPTVSDEAVPSADSSPMHWPSERSSSRSEEPQVRTLPVAAQATRGGGWVVALAAFAILAVLGAATALLVLRPQGSAGLPAPPAAIAPPPPPVPVFVAPTPTLEPPAFDEPPPMVVPSAAPPAPPRSARPRPPASTAPGSTRPTSPRPPPAEPDRPGPGF